MNRRCLDECDGHKEYVADRSIKSSRFRRYDRTAVKAVTRGPHTAKTTMTGCEQRFFSVEQSFLQLTHRNFEEHF